MNEPTEIHGLGYELEGLEPVQADEDFNPGKRLYDGAVIGTIHLYLNDKELAHGNYLPACFNVTDTARAQFELLESLARDGTTSGEAFCCACGDRGCAYIRWKMETDDRGDVRWIMEDLMRTEIGEHVYTCSFGQLQDLVSELHLWLIDFMKEQDIKTLVEPESEYHQSDNAYWSQSGLEKKRRAINEFRVA